MKEKIEIKKMPDKEILEAFLSSLLGSVLVSFDMEKGEFEWVVPRPDPLLGQPKTEEGWRIRGL